MIMPRPPSTISQNKIFWPPLNLAAGGVDPLTSMPPALPSQTASRQPGKLCRSQSRNTTASVSVNTNARPLCSGEPAELQHRQRVGAEQRAQRRGVELRKARRRETQEGESQQPVAGPLEAGEALDGHAAPARLDRYATAQTDEDKQDGEGARHGPEPIGLQRRQCGVGHFHPQAGLLCGAKHSRADA